MIKEKIDRKKLLLVALIVDVILFIGVFMYFMFELCITKGNFGGGLNGAILFLLMGILFSLFFVILDYRNPEIMKKYSTFSFNMPLIYGVLFFTILAFIITIIIKIAF